PVALDRGTGAGDEIGQVEQVVHLVVGQVLDGVVLYRVQQLRHRVGEFGAHPDLDAGVAHGLAASVAAAVVVAGETYEHEPVAHRRHDGVRAIPGGRHAADEYQPAAPGERLAAVGADVARP